MFGRIILAVDLDHLPQAAALLAQAVALLAPDGEVRLVHVLDHLPSFIAAELPDDVVDQHRAKAMVELRALCDPKLGVRMVPHIRHGAPAGQIIAAAEEQRADLIMLASHRPGLRDYVIGSTAARVMRHAPCTVLVGRAAPKRPQTKGAPMYSSIVIAAALFNDGATTRAALGRARSLLAPAGRVTLVHVLEEVPGYVASSLPASHMAMRKAEVTAQIKALADEAAGMTCDIVIEQGQPATTILDVAKQVGADLIMIASHKPGLSDYLIGSTASRVVRHAQTSVLVTR